MKSARITLLVATLFAALAATADAQCATGACPRPVAYQPVQYVYARPAVYAQPRAAVAADAAGFLAWLNATRAQYGLRAVAYDATLESVCYQNNVAQLARGLGHHYLGHGRRQNAGVGYVGVASVGAAWLNSPGHRAALLDPSISLAACRCDGAAWTFSAR